MDDPGSQQSSRIARTLYLATSAISGIGTVLTTLNGVSEQFKRTVSLLGGIPSWVSLIVAAALLLLCVWAFSKSRRRSILLRPDALRLERDKREHLVGRDDDIEALANLCRQHPLVFLEGVSGAGKSALIQAGLVPDIADDPTLLPIYVQSIVGVDWEREPRLLVRSALSSWLNSGGRDRFDPSTDWESLGVDGGLAGIWGKIGRLPLLILDQFDDYQVRHRDKFLKRKTWLNPDGLCSANSFWSELRELLAKRAIHLLIVTRADTAAGLTSVRFTEPEAYRLDRLPNQFVGPLLARLEQAGEGEIIADPAFGWEQLRTRLENDLEQDGTVLPQQLKVVLSGLGSFPRRELTPKAYQKIGGVRGIEARFIESQVARVARLFSLSPNNLRGALLSMADTETREKTIEQPQSKLLELIGEKAAAADALRELERGELVRMRQRLDLGETNWSLDHDYLARAVIEANKRANRWLHQLDAGAKSLTSSSSPFESWRALLPISTQLTFWRDRLLGRFHYANYRRYAAISLVRLVPYVLVVIAIISGTYYEWERREAQRVQNDADAMLNVFDRDGAILDREAATLLSLRSAEPAVRKHVIKIFLTNSDRAAIFLTNPKQLTRALTGLSPALRAWIRAILRVPQTNGKPENPELSATRVLMAENSGIDDLPLETWLAAVNATVPSSSHELNLAFAAAMAKLTDAPAAEAIAAVLKSIDSTTDPNALHVLGSGLTVLTAKVSETQAAEVIPLLLKAVVESGYMYTVPAVASGLAKLSAKLSDAQAAEAIGPFLKAIGSTTDPDALQAFGSGLAVVSAKLSPDQAPRAIPLFLDAIVSTTDQDALQALASSLAALRAKLSDIQAAEVTASFIETIVSITDDPDALQTLGSGLAAILGELNADQAVYAISLFLEAIGSTTDPDALQTLGSGFAALATKLSGNQAAEAIVPFLESIGGTTDPDALQTLGSGLVALSTKLSAPEAAETIGLFLEAIGSTSDPDALQALASGLAALPTELSDPQAAKAIGSFLEAIGRTNDPYALQALASGLAALPTNLSDQQAAESIGPFLESISSASDLDAVKALGSGLAILSAKLSDVQAVEATSRFLAAIGSSNNPGAIQALSPGLAGLRTKLTEAQAAEAIAPLVKAIDSSKNRRALQILGSGLATLSPKLSNAQAAEAIGPMLKTIVSTTDEDTLQTLGSGLAILSAKLSDAQAAEAIGPFLKAIGGTTDPDALQALGSGLAPLSTRLSANQAADAIAPFLEAIGSTTDPDVLQTLAPGLAILSAKLSATQAADAIAPFLKAISATTDVDALKAIGSGFVVLPIKLSDAQATEAVAPVLKAIGGTTSPENLLVLGHRLGLLSNKMSAPTIEAIASPSNVSGIMSGLSNPLVDVDLEKVLLQFVEVFSKSKFNGDVWKAVDWIKSEQEKGRLDWLDMDELQ